MDEHTTERGAKPMIMTASERSTDQVATYAEVVSGTLRTIRAHVDNDGNVALVAVGLSADEIKTACDRIKVLVS